MNLIPAPKKFARLLLIFIGFALFFGASLLLTESANASPHPQDADGTPTVTPTFDMKRLESPEVPEIRAQVDEGAMVYWGICMACHGDRGQGLTDEYRIGAFGEDANCWQSNCHGSDHPTPGFEMPKTLIFPALSTAGALGRFQNAQQLYDYVVEMMPWWDPRSLGSEKAWQVTAYLLKMRGTLPDGMVLSEINASAVPVHRAVVVPQNQNTGIFLFVGILVAAMIGFAVRDTLARRESASPSDPITGRSLRPSFIAHLHPPTIPALQSRFRYTLGAGGMAVFLSLVLVVTGLLEMFYYIPTPEKAAVSVETIVNFVPFGALVRNLHYWSAQLLVIVSLVHLARIIFTGAYGAQRKFNFLLGLGLFVFVVLLDFTGYVLRWDEGIRWALTAGTNLLKSVPVIGSGLYNFVLGGSAPGPAALIRFYAWHIFVLSLAAVIVMIWHLFRVRRDGGIAVAPAGQRGEMKRITRNELLSREVLGMFIGGIVLILLSTFLPAPIAPPIRSDTVLEAESSAPWFFLWVQQLLKLGDPFLLGVLVPLGVILFLGALPYLFKDIDQTELGRWFPRSGQRVQLIFLIIAVIVLALTAISILKAL